MKIDKFILWTFVHQSANNDCGLACIRMVMRYAGLDSKIFPALPTPVLPEKGMSLLELKILAQKSRLKASCVSLNMDYLCRMNIPCILHMDGAEGQHHFQVCYGARKKDNHYYFLMGDPANYVYYLKDDELAKQWSSKTALYFESIERAKNVESVASLFSLFAIRYFPRVLWISIPFLSLFIALFGLAISWLLQKGINDSLTDKKLRVIVAIICLLFLINIFRGFLSYLKYRLLIAISAATNAKLFDGMIKFLSKNLVDINKKAAISRFWIDAQKINTAISVSVSGLISDGILIMLLMSCIFFSLPLNGLINLIFCIIQIFVAATNLPALYYEHANLAKISESTENSLTREVDGSESLNAILNEEKAGYYKLKHVENIKMAKGIGYKTARLNLIYDSLAAIDVTLVLTYSLFRVWQGDLAYTSLMFTVFSSYFITIMLNRICNSLLSVFDGANSALEIKNILKDSTR